ARQDPGCASRCDHPLVTRARLMLVALAALAAGVGAALLAAGRVDEPYQTADAPLALLVGWTFVASGLVAWRQRPGNRLGPVMIFTGFAWFATFLTDAHAGWPFTLGTAIQSVYLVGFVYLVLSFPTGRLRGRADMALIAGAIALVTVVEWTSLLFSESHAVLCDRCPPNVLLVERNDGLASGLLQLQRITGVALALLTVVLLVRRWRAATAAERRSVAPVLWAGSATVVVLAVSIANDVVGEPLGQLGKWALYCVFASVPIA